MAVYKETGRVKYALAAAAPSIFFSHFFSFDFKVEKIRIL